MKLLLKKDIKCLGLVGDVVEVTEGYARNYLIPQDLAVEPTSANMKAIEEAKVKAAEQRRILAEQLQAAADRLTGVEVTIKAAANEEGVLYGSVGPREISAALRQEGHTVEAEQIKLHAPIRHLDNVMVPVEFAEDLIAEVKVWVVREATSEELADAESSFEGTEATDHADAAEPGAEH